MDWLEIVMEEYKTLRQESLTSMQMQQSILSLGAATIGISLSGAFATWDKSPLPEFLFLFLVPTLIYLVVLVWLGEVGRMFRAGYFLSELERRVNQEFTDKGMALSWETWLSSGKWAGASPHYVIKFHYVAIFVMFMMAAVASIAFGNYKIYTKLHPELVVGINVIELVPFVFVLVMSIRSSKAIAHGQGNQKMPEHNNANPADALKGRG